MMYKASFTRAFDHSFPPAPEGYGDVVTQSRIGYVPVAGVDTNVIRIDGTLAAIEACKTEPEVYGLWIETVEM